MQPNPVTLKSLIALLHENAKTEGGEEKRIQIILPNREQVPVHFHVTEVGRVQKDFVDCGGTLRHSENCTLQVWVADDLEHRLSCSKLAKILEKGLALFPKASVPIEFEYEQGTISQFSLIVAEASDEGVVLVLGTKKTACLAPDRCGVSLNVLSPCSTPDCC